MRKYVKRIASFFLIPLVQWYLKKEREYEYREIHITVMPGVFHPGFFYSTKFLLSYIHKLDLSRKTLLELGSGSGLISIVAAKAGAFVTASDLSMLAVQNTRQNAIKNEVNVTVVHSDVFDCVKGNFDFIIINPPYYAENASKESMLAWNCGKNFEYFRKLFRQLPDHIHSTSCIIMVLTKGCDIGSILSIAEASGFKFDLIKEKSVLFDEKDYLYKIQFTA